MSLVFRLEGGLPGIVDANRSRVGVEVERGEGVVAIRREDAALVDVDRERSDAVERGGRLRVALAAQPRVADGRASRDHQRLAIAVRREHDGGAAIAAGRGTGEGPDPLRDIAHEVDEPGFGRIKRPHDLVTHFDCLHDMQDPKGAARRVREALATDGTWMIVEPFAEIAGGEPQRRRARLRLGLDAALRPALPRLPGPGDGRAARSRA